MEEPTIDSLGENDLKRRDIEQQRLMNETCILVDENDQMKGFASKKTCHFFKNIQKGMLHRAFSVFLFDKKGDLLLQKRANGKITFPGLWTNTCCSHPLGIEEEYGENMEKSIEGVKRAAQRKLYHELGIIASQVPLEKFHYLTRVQYKAQSDEIWGENEIDYILFIQADVDLKLNLNEVETARYVNQDDLRKMLKCEDFKFTPWFLLICHSFIFFWWDNLNDLNAVKNQFSIIRIPNTNVIDFTLSTETNKLQMSAELAVSYAALILADVNIEITVEKLQTLIKSAGIQVENIMLTLFAKALKNRDVKELLLNVSHGAQTMSTKEAPAPAANAAAVQEVPKEEEKEESDEDVLYFFVTQTLLTFGTDGLRPFRLS
ncbi:hypothetical protein PCK1_000265 [Pneumocystis canis]|nr:hypothetical protein PCK1_000265 [Pneumocystis canis]